MRNSGGKNQIKKVTSAPCQTHANWLNRKMGLGVRVEIKSLFFMPWWARKAVLFSLKVAQVGRDSEAVGSTGKVVNAASVAEVKFGNPNAQPERNAYQGSS